MKISHLASAALGVAALALAGATQASTVTFASFSPVGSAHNIKWTNSGLNGALADTGRPVDFKFLTGPLAGDIVLATLDLAASETGNAAIAAGGQLIQPGIDGNFSFTVDGAQTVGGQAFANGANLLSGVFTTAALTGQAGGGSVTFSDSGTVSFTSSFLSLSPTEDYSFGLTSASPKIGATAGMALNTFGATAAGDFDASVPEPATWALMIGGLGMVGYSLRRRVKLATA